MELFMSKIFLGIGAGPIQTGIFVAGASKGHFDRIVLAEVDAALVESVRKSGTITVHTACADSVRTDCYDRIEIYNPSVPADLEILKGIAADALAVNTALPSTAFYKHCLWLKDAFAAKPEKIRYVYTSENSTTAADELRKVLGEFPQTHYLDTVIGKMSKVFLTSESDLSPLSPGYTKGHLVEEFNTIYTSCVPGLESVGIDGLYPKKNLYPFEEAKLYGHNASHFLLGMMAERCHCKYMNEAVNCTEIVKLTERILTEECGVALCKKFAGVDPYFESENFNSWARELVKRMTSPVLCDSVERVIRDIDRKFGWEDRVIGAIRLCLSQGVKPVLLSKGAALAAASFAINQFSAQWQESDERAAVIDSILSNI